MQHETDDDAVGSSSKVDTYMRMYWADYFADTRGFSALEHGAYMCLIGHYWRLGGPIPDDQKTLLRAANLTGRHGLKALNYVLAKFKLKDGAWHHKRIDAELVRARGGKAKLSERGRKGAAKRWADKSTDDATANATSMQQPMLKQCTSSVNRHVRTDGGGSSTSDPTPAPVSFDEQFGIPVPEFARLNNTYSPQVVNHYLKVCRLTLVTKATRCDDFAAYVERWILKDQAEQRGMYSRTAGKSGTGADPDATSQTTRGPAYRPVQRDPEPPPLTLAMVPEETRKQLATLLGEKPADEDEPELEPAKVKA